MGRWLLINFLHLSSILLYLVLIFVYLLLTTLFIYQKSFVMKIIEIDYSDY